jgi:hypothetical protein
MWTFKLRHYKKNNSKSKESRRQKTKHSSKNRNFKNSKKVIKKDWKHKSWFFAKDHVSTDLAERSFKQITVNNFM